MNAVSAGIMVRKSGQSGESDHERGFLSVSEHCEIVLVHNSAAAAAVAVSEGAACNSSSLGESCYCYCYSHHPDHHVGSVHVGSSPALGL